MNAPTPFAAVALRQRIVGVERCVPVAGAAAAPYVNFDNAATTPPLQAVLDHVCEAMRNYGSVHRGSGYKSRHTTALHDAARCTVARFVGARDGERSVVFGKNATEAINQLAHRLPLAPDDVVLVSLLEHHSNDLPWRARCRVVHVRADAHGQLDEDHLDALLREHAGRVRLLCVTGGSNVTGVTPPIHRLAIRMHDSGAMILVDAAQLAAHRRIDVGALDDPAQLDFLALSGHKHYAPFGAGALVARRDVLAEGEPGYRGGGTIRFVSTRAVDWADGPERDEAGTPNVAGILAMARAMELLDEIGLDAIARHEAALSSYALRRLASVDGIRLYGDADPAGAANRLGVISFNLERHPHALVAAMLGYEHAIGVRNGCFCAQPYASHLLGMSRGDVERYRAVIAHGDRSAIPGMVRVSFGLYNTFDEVDRLVDALQAMAQDRPMERYRVDRASGDFRPVGVAARTA